MNWNKNSLCYLKAAVNRGENRLNFQYGLTSDLIIIPGLKMGALQRVVDVKTTTRTIQLV